MPEFVSVDSAGGVSRRNAGIDLAPLLLREVPGTPFSKAGATTGEGIAYRRDGSGNSQTAQRRYIISVWEGNEEAAGRKYGLRETGGMEWRPGGSNPIFLLPVSDMMGSGKYGMKLGGSNESSASYDVANAGLDLMCGVRLSQQIDWPIFDSSGNWKNYDYGAAARIQWRIHERLLTIPASASQVDDTILIPSSCWLIALYSKVKDASSAGLTYSLGIPSDPARFGTGHAADSLGYDSLHVDAAVPMRYYPSGETLRVTLSGATANQFQLGVFTILWRLPDTTLSGTAPFDA